LIAVGREHFLRHGIGDAVAEAIAEEAGFSRGAFYSNFEGKEDLFLAVMMAENERRHATFENIRLDRGSAADRIKRLRETYTNLIMDRDWIVLRAEFEAGALRSERMRQSFVEAYKKEVQDAVASAIDLIQLPGVTFHMSAHDVVVALITFSYGMAVKQKILGTSLPQKTTRTLIESCVGFLVWGT
jgi:AcrR family transcriptional regulator